MMTVSKAITVVRERLATHTCPDTDAAREAEALVCLVAALTREEASMHPETALDDATLPRLGKLVTRRLAHEPLAYLLGTAPFLGNDFEVTSATLIPRPATEVLVQAALSFAKDRPEGTVVVDVGTGSGCIAVTLAASLPHPVVATDTSPDALEVARRNAVRHGVDGRTAFLLSDGIEAAAPLLVGHELVIVANLPYLPSGMMPTLTKEVRHEPDSALDGGTDGLDDYRTLFAQIDGLPKASVTLFAEMLVEQIPAFRALAEQHGFTGVAEIKNDADVAVGVRCVRSA
jgi:release factor glutamine methyltransferase